MFFWASSLCRGLLQGFPNWIHCQSLAQTFGTPWMVILVFFAPSQGNSDNFQIPSPSVLAHRLPRYARSTIHSLCSSGNIITPKNPTLKKKLAKTHACKLGQLDPCPGYEKCSSSAQARAAAFLKNPAKRLRNVLKEDRFAAVRTRMQLYLKQDSVYQNHGRPSLESEHVMMIRSSSHLLMQKPQLQPIMIMIRHAISSPRSRLRLSIGCSS